ncbi:MAG TPA: hypothetical protein VG406_19820 [Isosphaeraceae bacterium]|nr:hypothetical protein [Isosphaeraceae bacterium]
MSRPPRGSGGGPGPLRGGAGLRVLVPGLPQWRWRQRERGAALFGSFAAALGMSLFTWGTRPGLLLLAFAFGAHVTSVADVIRQGAFPAFARWVPWVSASFGLGIGCYAPMLALASVLAWPGLRPGVPLDGYLVNRWVLLQRDPGPGEAVWVDAGDGRGPWLARVLAMPGQGVEWSDERLRVAGQVVAGDHVVPFPAQVKDLRFEVPRDHLLVVQDGPEDGVGSGRPGPRLVSRGQVIGLAWARLYPVWRRRLLR